MKIAVNPPDVNISSIDFIPVDDKTISFGLNAIKNVGTKALEQIIESRKSNDKYNTIFDFTANVALKTVNKKVLESLIMSGAMDSLDGNRAQKFNEIEVALKYGQNQQDVKSKNQVDLFGAGDSENSSDSMAPTLSNIEEWPESKMLENEKEVLGLYLSGHPLLKYADDLEEYSNYDFTDKINYSDQDKIRIGGAITDLKLHFDKKNNQMAFFKLDCLGGQAEILAFSSVFSKYKDLIKSDSVVFIKGKQTDETDFSDLKLIAEEIVTVENAKEIYSKNVNIRVDLKDTS
jgi:DNA polymerase III, alpha subunit